MGWCGSSRHVVLCACEGERWEMSGAVCAPGEIQRLVSGVFSVLEHPSILLTLIWVWEHLS